ncbi:uncharacterized protein LOC124387065 [Tachysurus ichikawai]
MFLWLSLGDSMADSLKPLFTQKVVDEVDGTLSYSYKDFSGAVQNLQRGKRGGIAVQLRLALQLDCGFRSHPFLRDLVKHGISTKAFIDGCTLFSLDLSLGLLGLTLVHTKVELICTIFDSYSGQDRQIQPYYN